MNHVELNLRVENRSKHFILIAYWRSSYFVLWCSTIGSLGIRRLYKRTTPAKVQTTACFTISFSNLHFCYDAVFLLSSLLCWLFLSASVVKTRHYAATTQANRQQGREKNCAIDDEPVTATKRARTQSHSVSVQFPKAFVLIFNAKPCIKGSIPKTLSKS